MQSRALKELYGGIVGEREDLQKLRDENARERTVAEHGLRQYNSDITELTKDIARLERLVKLHKRHPKSVPEAEVENAKGVLPGMKRRLDQLKRGKDEHNEYLQEINRIVKENDRQLKQL